MACLFFFQAEDGIRDADVTGVQTCALPISEGCGRDHPARSRREGARAAGGGDRMAPARGGRGARRSEERRVGKECRWRGGPYEETEKEVHLGGPRLAIRLYCDITLT